MSLDLCNSNTRQLFAVIALSLAMQSAYNSSYLSKGYQRGKGFPYIPINTIATLVEERVVDVTMNERYTIEKGCLASSL